ncbi:rho GTPase-activating protein conundrum-like isoform X2 [Diorhabda sublineata]|uniref:rho GTPase-activating protein conundrum-like isoform X2 n=1 Tax=Diorhabda sublineata TaxID=1163346 RepID=UPI0024E141D6|nr:rho GTPase-activating protein conundrum-like isoform X2 [Diorhabda sublineata]
MESEDALKYYLDEVKDTQNDIHHIEEEIRIPNEAEQATDFLQNAGLADLSRLYQQGKEITENVIKDSVRQRNLSEKQAQTIRSRVRILNQTLRSRQPRRKQRQDIRDISWNAETSSTGTRSRSATPDSLDSLDALNDELTYDDDQQLTSLPPFPLDLQQTGTKKKIKSTNSEPLQSKKFYRNDRCDVAHLGSENVVLKGYQVLSENGTLPRSPRERSGSDPTTEIHFQPLKQRNSADVLRDRPNNLHSPLSRSHTNISTNCSKVYLNRSDENEIQAVSFEGMLKKDDSQENTVITEKWDNEGLNIDQLSDSEYQYLKPLLYMELVAIFDHYKIVKSYLKRKASKNKGGGNVFGVNLSTLVMRDMPRPNDNCMVPEIFQTVIKHLTTRCIKDDGILRIASQKMKLETLCNEIESKFYTNRKEVENLLGQATVHELTGVLKKLLRDLPDPIFTVELFEMFYKTSEITDAEHKLKALNLLVLMLPIEHRNTYRLLLNFFRNIIDNEKHNRMNLHNVAMITAPSLFPPRLLLPKENTKLILKQLSKDDLTKQIKDAALCCLLMETMLTAGDQLWTVPKYLADQAKEAQKRAQVKKDMSKDQDKRIRSGKTKLVRSSTQYEPGAMNLPRLKRDFFS